MDAELISLLLRRDKAQLYQSFRLESPLFSV
jgi:hypothetical protein